MPPVRSDRGSLAAVSRFRSYQTWTHNYSHWRASFRLNSPAFNEEADSDLFESVHGLLIELIDGLETAMPALRAKREKAEAKANQQEAARLLKEMKLAGELPDERDIIENIKRILGDEGRGDPVGVPAKRKPGPKGLTGGVALPLPDSDSET